MDHGKAFLKFLCKFKAKNRTIWEKDGVSTYRPDIRIHGRVTIRHAAWGSVNRCTGP